MTLTERIKFLSKPLNYTFASIERELEFGQGTIRKWDNSIPSADKLLKVAKLLNTTIEWLLTGEQLSENISSGEVSGNSNVVSSNEEDYIFSKQTKELIQIYETFDLKNRYRVIDLVLKIEQEIKENEQSKIK